MRCNVSLYEGNFSIDAWFLMRRESEGEGEPVPVYLSRNVLLYTHYSGDVASVVDTHFTKALNQTSFHHNKGSFITGPVS